MKKVLSFVFSKGKFLALHSEPHPKHGDCGWFIVTGEVESGESLDNAVRREIKEETGLDSSEILSLNWGSIYEWCNEICEEMNFITFVKPGKIKLNEEHNKYEWMNLDNFVERIKWDDDKNLLKKVLTKALNKKLHFLKKEIKNYI